MIVAEHLSKNYKVGRNSYVALQDISLNIPDGLTVAITGRSGSGKSTLMQVLSGLDRPDNGSVSVDNTNIHKISKRKRDKFHSQQVGFVFQSFYTLPKEPVWKNVALPLELQGQKPQARRQQAMTILRYVGLTNYANRAAGELSGGQLQRVCVARALVSVPKYIFADEPTGNLDPFTGQVITKLLFAMNQQKGSTLVLVTHNPTLAHLCHVEIVMQAGKIINIFKHR